MALVTPIINEIAAFDATQGAVITFSANGGSQVVKNEIKIATDVIIDYELVEYIFYQDITTSYAFEHIIPPNAGEGDEYYLRNGGYYKVAVRTYDIYNNVSEWSEYQPFYCYTTPTLSFDIISGQTIDEESFDVTLTYRQTEGEKIDYVIIQLYNNNNVLVDSSGNLYSTDEPPIDFVYGLLGLENHSQYYLNATGVTINGTIIKSDNIIFYTNYETVITDTKLVATLDNCNGYVNLHSSSIINLMGISNPIVPTYIDNSMISLLGAAGMDSELYGKWVKCEGAISTPNNFLLRMWFYPARQPFKLLELNDNFNEHYLRITFNRGTTEDFICIRTDEGTIIDKGLGLHCNGNTKVFLWIDIVDDTWTVETEILSTETTIINWNDSSDNIYYGVDVDMTWSGESFENYTPQTNVYRAINFSYTNLKISNGIFDAIEMNKDTNTPYSTIIPAYDIENTIVGFNFNNSLFSTAPYYTKMLLKRRDENLLTWLTLSEIEIGDNIPTFINFNDSFIPTGIEQTYALVIYSQNAPSEYYTTTTTPQWGKYFLSDKNNRFILNYSVLYNNNSQNIQNGVLMPIGSAYPIVIQNAKGNYRSGSLQFKVLGYQYEIDKKLDRNSIIKETDDILNFLTNGMAKCLTDFNGNIFIFKVINSPQITYDANWGNGITTISFDWVEQTKYNDYEGMLSLGLFDYISK